MTQIHFRPYMHLIKGVIYPGLGCIPCSMNRALGLGQPFQGLVPGSSSLPALLKAKKSWLSWLFPINWILFNASAPIFTMNRGNISAQALVLSGTRVLRCIAAPLQRCFTALRRKKSSAPWPYSSLGRLHPPADTQQWGIPHPQAPKTQQFPSPLGFVSPPAGLERNGSNSNLILQDKRRVLNSFFPSQSAICVINGRREKLGKERREAVRPAAHPSDRRWMRLLRAGKRRQRAELKSHPKPMFNIYSWVRAPGG